MASKGVMVNGTDGRDFQHREQVASQFKISAKVKYRLKWCSFIHFSLFLAMMLKLMPDILDRTDVFVLEIEELEVPKPLMWEYLWLLSVPSIYFCLSAIRKNNPKTIRVYQIGIIMFGVCPVLFGLFYYFSTVHTLIDGGKLDPSEYWQGFPYAALWYIFLIPSLQVHGFSLYFSSQLYSAWITRGVKKVN